MTNIARETAKVLAMASSYGNKNIIMNASMNFYQRGSALGTYNDIKEAVRYGVSIMKIMEMKPAGQPNHIIIDLYKRAKAEVWEETQPQRTVLGGYLYI